MVLKAWALLLLAVIPGGFSYDCYCPKRHNPRTDTHYSQWDIENAIKKAYSINPSPENSNPGPPYPHLFLNHGHLDFEQRCSGSDLVAFPLLEGQIYNKKMEPGDDRVVYALGPGKKFCGCMYHSPNKGGDFQLCTGFGFKADSDNEQQTVLTPL